MKETQDMRQPFDFTLTERQGQQAQGKRDLVAGVVREAFMRRGAPVDPGREGWLIRADVREDILRK